MPQFDNIRLDAEDFLFDADAVQHARCGATPPSARAGSGCRGAAWTNLIRTAVQRGFWREKDGLVAEEMGAA